MERLMSIGKFLLSRPVWLSLVEAAFVLCVSNAALLFLVFAYIVETKDSSFSFHLAFTVINNNINSTEVLVYLLALIAPALWVMFYNWRASRHAVFYYALVLLQFVIIAGSAYIYGKAKFGGIHNQAFVDRWAFYCLFIGVLIWYVTLVYDKWLPTAPHAKPPESGEDILRQLESKV